MTTQTDVFADVITTAAQLVRQRGHDRRNEAPHDVAADAPLSVVGAVRAAAYQHDINTARAWMPLLGRVINYWQDTQRCAVWQWESANRDRDVTAEAADHLAAAATYQR